MTDTSPTASTPLHDGAGTALRAVALRPGDRFHWLRSGVVFRVSEDWGGSEISQRGQTVTVTDALLRANRDRLGGSWLDLLTDEAQITQWGEIRWRPGPAPADLQPWTPGSAEQDIARDRARAAAWALPEGPGRDQALANVDKMFGRLKTSRTLWEEPRPADRIEWVPSGETHR